MDSSPARNRVSAQRIQKLLDELRPGSAASLGTVLDLYRPYLLATARARLEPRLKAKAGPSDLVQETMVAAHRAWEQLDEKPATADQLREWLRNILLEQLKKLRRRYYRAQSRSLHRERSLDEGESKRLLDLIAASTSEKPSSAANRAAMTEQLEAALARLPAPYRQIIIWRSKDCRPFAEIGERMDRSADAARMLWRRAIRQLKHELGVGNEDK